MPEFTARRPRLFVLAATLLATLPLTATADVQSLNGIWVREWSPQQGGPPAGARPQLTAAALEVAEAYDLLLDDPGFECSPSSLSRLWAEPATPLEIDLTDNRVIFRHEYMDVVRTMYLDGRERPTDLPSRVLGHAIGWLEDATLVIDSRGFSASVLSTVRGYPQTGSLHTIERLTPDDDGNRFQLEITFADPATFVTPWQSRLSFIRAPEGQLPLEYGCSPESADPN